MKFDVSVSPRPPTLTDLARESNLSIATVSRALRGHPAVSPATQQRVKELAAGLGYQTSATARALRTGKHDAIALVLSEHALEGGSLARGAARAATDCGLSLLVRPLLDDSRRLGHAAGGDLEQFFRHSVRLPVDGFIVVAPQGDKWEAHLDRPVVVVGGNTGHRQHTVMADNQGAARAATTHLIVTGRRLIVAVAPEPSDQAIQDRLIGYRETMNAHGLLPRVVSTTTGGSDATDRTDVVERLMRNGAPFDSVMSMADSFGGTLLRSLREHQVRVPQEVAVVSFDRDSAAVATDPALTTVAEPMAEIGALAVESLRRLLGGEDLPPHVQHVPIRLVQRGSS